MKRDQAWMDRHYLTIGRRICNSPVVALAMRHKNPIDTLRDYGDVGEPEDTPEWLGKLFVKEFSMLCSGYVSDRGDELERFVQRWTGLDDPVGDLIGRISESSNEQMTVIASEKEP